MILTIIAIDKLKKTAPEQTLIDAYIKQSGWKIKIIELEAKKGLTGAARKTEESRLLLEHVPQGAQVVALDERGETMFSKEFASRLIRWQDNGVKDVVFLIGGAEGHTDALRDRADLLLSFGKMTLPHLLMRVVLTEQLYRAYTISIGHPYHKN